MFRAEARGQPLVLDNAGVVGGNEVFKDRGTGSRWQQSSLEAISGPLQGAHLELYPFLLTSWQEWHRLHPDTLVLKPLPGYADRIAEKNKMIREGLSGEGAAPKDVTYHDDRLKPKTMILGIDVGGASKAYPLDDIASGAHRERPGRRPAGADRASADVRYDHGVRGTIGRKDTHLRCRER